MRGARGSYFGATRPLADVLAHGLAVMTGALGDRRYRQAFLCSSRIIINSFSVIMPALRAVAPQRIMSQAGTQSHTPLSGQDQELRLGKIQTTIPGSIEPTVTLLERVNAHLTRKGLLLKRGTMVDATIIDAPPSTKNDEGTATRRCIRPRRAISGSSA